MRPGWCVTRRSTPRLRTRRSEAGSSLLETVRPPRRGGPVSGEQLRKIRSGSGFIAALDQSGGSTPKALQALRCAGRRLRGRRRDVRADRRDADPHHRQPLFGGDRVLGTILFEDTMDREIEGRGSVDYLWKVKGMVPFLKVDKGLADESDGVQTMRPMPGLDALALPGQDQRCLRHQDALFHKARRPSWRAGRRRSAVCGSPPDPRHPAGADHRTGNRHPQSGEATSRGVAQGGNRRAPGSTRSRSARHVEGLAPRDRRFLRGADRAIRMCSVSSLSPGATAAKRPTRACLVTTA